MNRASTNIQLEPTIKHKYKLTKKMTNQQTKVQTKTQKQKQIFKCTNRHTDKNIDGKNRQTNRINTNREKDRQANVQKVKQAMITLHGMAENRLTSVYFFTNVFLGEIFFYPLNS